MKKIGLNNGSSLAGMTFGHWRIYSLVFFVFFMAVCVGIKLYFLQVTNYKVYQDRAENQHKVFQTLNPNRGEIYLSDEKDPYPVAVNRQMQMVYIVPKEIEDKNMVAENLAGILQIDKSMLDEKMSNPEDMFEIIKHKLIDEEVSQIKELKIKGIYLTPETFRFYPSGELASQVVGFVGSDGKEMRGMYGIEASLNDKLEGKSGSLSQEKDTRGGWISTANREINPAEDGVDLILTINHTVQYETEKILKETVEKHQADNGTAIVMAPKSGKILAMANYPSFNPNEYSQVEDISVFANPAVDSVYESGSVFKAFTMSAGIDDGKVNPDTTYVDSGGVHEAGYEIRNSDNKANGKQTMTQVLEKSINTGVIFVEKLLGNQKFADYVERFGFGTKTNVDLPGEINGNITNLDNLKSNIQFFTSSFGQGISVTPLQLINGYAAIANGGMLMKPQIIDKIAYPDGHMEEIQPQEIKRVITQDSANQIAKMLRSVVVNGHGKKADVPGYLVAGKTGTAQVPKSDGRGYEDGITIGSFAGFAPMDDPQFVVLVKIYHPKDVQWAESTAGPAFGKIMKFLFDYYGVEPTESYDINKLNQAQQISEPTTPPVSTVVEEKTKKDKKKK
jgi:cell division protein FtsI/penicillin-binding protein 2